MSLVTPVQTGLITGTKPGLNGLYGGSPPVVVPTDGPDSVYRPQTAEQWSALGITVPDYLYLCQDTTGALTDEFGTLNMPVAAGSPVYSIAVSGWSANHVGLPGGTVAGFGWAAGVGPNPNAESYAILSYSSCNSGGANEYMFPITLTGSLTVLRYSTSSRVNNLVAGSSNIGTSTSYFGSNTIRAFLHVWRRLSHVDVYTSLEQIEVVRSTSIQDGFKGWGSPASVQSPTMRSNMIAVWKGDAAIATLGKSTLTALGWSLPY